MKVLERIIKVNRCSTIIVVMGICLLQVPEILAAESNPFTEGSGGNTIDWYYWSPLTVVENITDIGGGSYRYEYSFVNVDTSPIWEFVVNTTFVARPGNKFTGHLSWGGPVWYLVTKVYPEYDTRNLDPDIIGLIGTYTKPWWPDPVTAVQINEAASGFSFTASIYDPSPKYYFYETIASGWTQTNGTGKVAAVGLTIPEPGTVLLVGLGGLGLTRRRRAVAREMN